MRHAFAGDIASYVIAAGTDNVATLTGGITITFWSAPTGGTQYTNLSPDSGGATTTDHIISSSGTDGYAIGQIPMFYGPDNVVIVWAEANGGPRAAMLAIDIPALVVSNTGSIGTLAVQLAEHISAANPHAMDLEDISNVEVDPDDLVDGQALLWDVTAGRWKAVSIAGVTGTVTLGTNQTITGTKTFGPTGNVNQSRMLMYAEDSGQVADVFQAWSGSSTGFGGQRQKTTYLNEKGELRAIAADINSVPVRIKGQPGQTAHITEWTNTSNVAVSWVEPDGRLRAPNSGYVLALSVDGNLSVAAGKHRLYNDSGVALTIRAVRASVGTAPVGAAVIADVLKNGASIFTSPNRPTIAAAANTSGRVTAIASTTWSDGEYLTVDIAQIGSSTAGANLVLQVMAY